MSTQLSGAALHSAVLCCVLFVVCCALCVMVYSVFCVLCIVCCVVEYRNSLKN